VVVSAKAGFYTVHTAGGQVVCRIRGRLKRSKEGRLLSSPIAVGDRVRIGRESLQAGVVEEVQPRGRVFSRQARGHPPREQVILANADQAVLVFAITDPQPNPRLIDRFLTIIESAELPAILCFNKVDLSGDHISPVDLRVYEEIGYRVLNTSVSTGAGVAELRAALAGKISVFSGPSGVGKSSLINAIQPGLKRDTGDVSRWSGKGMHTTRETVLLPLDSGGYIADTAGIRQLIPWDLVDQLDWCYREFRPFINDCRYYDCSHIHEPGCAVRAAVDAGQISAVRYDSYCRFQEQMGEE